MITGEVSFSEPLPLHYSLKSKMKNRLRFWGSLKMKKENLSLYNGKFSVNNKLTSVSARFKNYPAFLNFLCLQSVNRIT